MDGTDPAVTGPPEYPRISERSTVLPHIDEEIYDLVELADARRDVAIKEIDMLTGSRHAHERAEVIALVSLGHQLEAIRLEMRRNA